MSSSFTSDERLYGNTRVGLDAKNSLKQSDGERSLYHWSVTIQKNSQRTKKKFAMKKRAFASARGLHVDRHHFGALHAGLT
jgi:hypothetical protein